ncbi:transglutaminase-like putative cysteine protease [Marmoricola sp. OAE513]|uniref:transglutaminase family protein n=1 Tax=Marmoricola sp. OAE513 TaxID=2817894 RepID=UPI001AE77020
MTERTAFTLAGSLVAAVLGWVAICSWRGLVEHPAQFSGPALVAALLIALVGSAGRVLRLRWYAVLPLQLVVVTVWFHHRQRADDLLGGWVPTPHGLAELFGQVRDGAEAINSYGAPVSASFVDAPVYLIAVGAGVVLLVDLLACGLRHPAWAGLPVLVAVTIPISVLDGGLPVPVYVGTALGFALLLAVLEADRAMAWGLASDTRGVNKDDPVLRLGALGAPALGIGAATTAAALVLSLGVPVGDGFFRESGKGGGTGSGEAKSVSLTNPLVNLRRDLVRNDHLPLLDATTDASDPTYVRLTVLDRFRKDAWVPSPRSLEAADAADGRLPEPEGLSPGRPGSSSSWDLVTSRAFRTTWLPTPYSTRTISIDDGDWRYDPNFLDIANVDDTPPTGVGYRLTAFTPAFSSAALDQAPAPPPDVLETMTATPDLPKVVTDIATEITAAGKTQYAKAVLLQDWFRSKGGFTYSLAPAAGEGLEQLARFVTTDKVGYCEQFAATMALMARSLGIPARVVVGFLSPSESSGTDLTYTSDDLHAWPEIYFRGYGWVRFEPTPSTRTGSAPNWTRGNVDRPDPALPTTTQAPETSAPAPTAKPDAEVDPVEPTRSTSTPVLPIAVGALLLLLVAAVTPRALRNRQRMRRLDPKADPRADVEGLWDELRATCLDHGIAWPETRSPQMIADLVADRVFRSDTSSRTAEDRAVLETLVRLVERARYQERFEPDELDRLEALEAVGRWSDLIELAVTTRQARLAAWAPRSLFAGAGRAVAARNENSLSDLR